jgi:two-component system response regulator NreC
METYRIVIADDHAIFRQGLKRLLKEAPLLEIVGETGQGAEVESLVADTHPDLLILDISLPDLSGIEITRRIKKRFADVKILILTMHTKMEYLYHAIAAGAQGYVTKEDSDIELFAAIEAIRKGAFYATQEPPRRYTHALGHLLNGRWCPRAELLTRREKEIVRLVAEGFGSRAIAGRLRISVRTVENHRYNAMHKLNLTKTADLVRYALTSGLA